ncbi:MAG: 3-demethylubiquinone-9 3-methyltransferase [Ignavibacteria bacterium]|nr:MAG: 3-demethylubiquinone-9 3-methyltransferase [Ignavibacteria bacterium]KAF0160655.1 MAG: 3-demethylubiquinone-9 3-methyltransferase [Ignavibacteria bacterium]
MAEKHFYEQAEYTKKYLIPYFQKHIPEFHKLSVLEVGCAEGGLLESLMDLGMEVCGIELSVERAAIAKEKNPKLNILVGDIMDLQLQEKLGRKFDFVILREVIEHVPNKYAAFKNLNLLTNHDGYLFVSFPPKRSPFAGHQQIARSFLKMIPYLHILPQAVLRTIAKKLGEKEDYVDEIKLHFSTGLVIKQFETLCALNLFEPLKTDLFLFRPIYAYRFGLPTIKLPNIPLIREFISLGCEVLLRKQFLPK